MIRSLCNGVAVFSESFVHKMESGGMVNLPKSDGSLMTWTIQDMEDVGGAFIIRLARFDLARYESTRVGMNEKYLYLSPEEQQHNKNLRFVKN
jgi:hypothetical protein